MSKRQRPDQKKDDAERIAPEKNNLTDLDDIFTAKKKSRTETTTDKTKGAKTSKTTATAKSSAAKKAGLSYSRDDVDKLSEKDWVDDGLGGKFNKEGYTGRLEGGVKIFKAHLFNRPNFGKTPDCPFDCDCCFI